MTSNENEIRILYIMSIDKGTRFVFIFKDKTTNETNSDDHCHPKRIHKQKIILLKNNHDLCSLLKEKKILKGQSFFFFWKQFGQRFSYDLSGTL